MIKINKSKKSSPLSKGRGKPWIHSRNCELHDWVIARSWSKVGIGFYFCWVNFYFSVMMRFHLSSRVSETNVAIQIFNRQVCFQSRLLRYRSQWRSKKPGLLRCRSQWLGTILLYDLIDLSNRDWCSQSKVASVSYFRILTVSLFELLVQ